MSSIARPASLRVRDFYLDLKTNQRVFGSQFEPTEDAVDLLNDRWTAGFTLPARRHALAPEAEAWLAAMRNMTNTTPICHERWRAPRGTMRGTPTLQASAAKGASTVSIQTTAGATLLMGDLIGVSGLLLMAAADATANGSGVMSLSLVNRLRKALSSGASVTWSAPSVEMRMVSSSGARYVPGSLEPISCVFVEAI